MALLVDGLDSFLRKQKPINNTVVLLAKFLIVIILPTRLAPVLEQSLDIANNSTIFL